MANLTTASRLANAELANLLGELTTARNPSWVLQPVTESPPQDATDGVSLSNGSDGGAVIAHVQVRVRRVAAYRTAIYQIGVANADTYNLSFDGPAAAFPAGPVAVSYVSDGSATAQEIAEGLKAAIEANGTLNANLLAYAEKDPTTGLYRLRVTGKPGSNLDSDDFEIITASTPGAGTLTVSADPLFCRIVIWGLPGGDRLTTTESKDSNQAQPFADFDADEPAEETSPWLQTYLTPEPGVVPTGVLEGKVYVHTGGYVDRLQVAGLSRLCVQIKDVTGHPNDLVGAPPTYFDPRVFIGQNRRESARLIGS